MKLGYLCQFSDAEAQRAARLGFKCLETHAGSLIPNLDVPSDLAEVASRVGNTLAQNNISISAISFYGNPLTEDVAKTLARYRAIFDLARRLGVGVVTSMAGNLPDRPFKEGMARFAEVFGPIAQAAEDAGLRVAFENWPGMGGDIPWHSVNLAWSPRNWSEMFDRVKSPALGLEFDPSHLVWQGIDHMQALRDFKDRVYHSHAKDTEMLVNNVRREGILGIHHNCWRYRIPGYGVINWAEYISGLIEIGYDGGIAIEHEDPVFSGERFEEGLVRGFQVLNPLINPG
ncbi:MAG: sugar phosphate isomerase/epimerase [Chloroflexi bacterium]|nr:sugar phosphate isomerase/epimerase [Chloroflexota bacterium]